MRRFTSFLPEHARILLKRLGIAVLTLYITRLIFVFFNSEAFTNLRFVDYITAIWFDMITVGLFFIPYYALYLLPFNLHNYRAHRIFFKMLFHITNGLLLALNLLDVEYFKFTSKRSTYDLFTTVGTGNDVNQLLLTFLKDFWHLFVFLILLIGLAEFLYRKTEPHRKNALVQPPSHIKNVITFCALTPLLFVMGRGGFGLKPTGIMEATRFTLPENTAFIVTTPFTIIKTIDQKALELKEFYASDEECEQYFTPIQSTIPQNILSDSTNVMIIMLESFGVEFVGSYNNNNGFTPFLDSIIDESLSFNHAFANGKKSIEAVPAVIASLPTLMDSPYIHSPYGNNKINSLPNILKEHGYESAFYHGATNGSMSFDGFASLCGYDHYVGRFEYDNEEHSDMTWGILDEYFNPWTARQMSELKEPFFTTLFTLSSHHPYFIPDNWKNKVKTGPQKICASINYGDHALRLFFEEAKKQPWYDNTLFVILADHTPSTMTPLYNLRSHMYKIPIAFYHPSGQLKAERSDRIFQQLDILPTILDLLNIETDYYSFGNSFYQKPEGEAITYLEGTYYYFKEHYMMTFTEEKARNLYDFTVQSTEQIDSISYFKNEVIENEKRLKAIIQRYSRDLIMNQTTTDEKEN